jgi:hypothetical protein
MWNGPASLKSATHLRHRRVDRAGDFRLPIVVIDVVVAGVGFALVCFRHVYREGESEARDIGWDIGCVSLLQIVLKSSLLY